MTPTEKLIDGKIRRNIIEGKSIDYVINILTDDKVRFRTLMINQNISPGSTRAKGLETYIKFVDKRVEDLAHMKILSNRFKFNNEKLFKLIEFKTKN
jgi:hypothetical protein